MVNKLARLPVIHKLKTSPPRKGFFEQAQFEKVRSFLPLGLQAAVTIAYTYGWRMQSEVLPLEWRRVDWVEDHPLRLSPPQRPSSGGTHPGFSENVEDRLSDGGVSRDVAA